MMNMRKATKTNVTPATKPTEELSLVSIGPTREATLPNKWLGLRSTDVVYYAPVYRQDENATPEVIGYIFPNLNTNGIYFATCTAVSDCAITLNPRIKLSVDNADIGNLLFSSLMLSGYEPNNPMQDLQYVQVKVRKTVQVLLDKVIQKNYAGTAKISTTKEAEHLLWWFVDVVCVDYINRWFAEYDKLYLANINVGDGIQILWNIMNGEAKCFLALREKFFGDIENLSKEITDEVDVYNPSVDIHSPGHVDIIFER